MLNRDAIESMLKKNGIPFAVTVHPAIYNMEEAAAVTLPWPQDEAKNLFLRDDKKRQYYLLSVKGDKPVDLKALRTVAQSRPLSLAAADDLKAMLELEPGAVTPFGLLNKSNCGVIFWIDEEFFQGEGRIGVHPNDNTATLWLNVNDLLTILKHKGIEVQRLTVPLKGNN